MIVAAYWKLALKLRNFSGHVRKIKDVKVVESLFAISSSENVYFVSYYITGMSCTSPWKLSF